MRRKVTAQDWRFPLRMTRKQWSSEHSATPLWRRRSAISSPIGATAPRALPPGALLPLSASLLLGPQGGHDAGGMGESGCGLPPAAGAAVDRIAERFGGAVAVLKRGG